MIDQERLEHGITKAMGNARVPGLALGVIENGSVLYANGFGVTSVEDGGLPVTAQTLFRIGSVTKALTGTLILRLVEAGALDLDTPVTAYVPWFTLSNPALNRGVTLRRLLSHTSGLPTDHAPFGPREPDALERRIRNDIPRYPLVAPPGERYHYSNVGLHIAGYLAEAVSGRPYADLMQDMVFEPLGMERTTFDPLVALTYPTALAHEMGEDGTPRVEHCFSENTACRPSGYALSNVDNLCRFAQMLMGGGPQILSAQSLMEMQSPQVVVSAEHEVSYGLTLFVETYKGVRRVGHSGDIRSYGALLFVAPDQGTGVVLLFNRSRGFWATAESLMNGLFDELLGLPAESSLPSRRAVYIPEDA